MRESIHKQLLVACLLLGGWWCWLGCDSKPLAEKPVQLAKESSSFPISVDQVGDYQIGKSTLVDVLGEDTPEARKQLTARGLNCEFNEGGVLSAVTITSSDYAFPGGLAVGSQATEVRAKLGDPIKTSFQSGQLKFNALVYARLAFLLDDQNSVYAIRVGE